MITGRTNNLLAFYLNHKLKLIAGGTLLGIFFLFGVKTPIFFVLKSVGSLSAIAALIYTGYWYRKRNRMGVYDDVVRLLNKNRFKLEEAIGGFDIPKKNQIAIEHKKTPFPGRKFPLLTYHFNLVGTQGQCACRVTAVKMPHYEGRIMKKDLMITSFIVHTQSARESRDGANFVLLHKTVRPIIVTGVAIDE